MILDLTEKEVSILKKVLEASSQAQDSEFKVGDKVKLRKYTTYGGYSTFYEVKDVDFDERTGRFVYSLEGLELEKKLEYEPSTGLSYGAGIGASYDTVTQNVVLTGFNGGNGSMTKMAKKNGNSYIYEQNKRTGRFIELKNTKLSLVTDEDIGSVIASYEIDDPAKVEKLFAAHPEWEEDGTRTYNMSRN